MENFCLQYTVEPWAPLYSHMKGITRLVVCFARLVSDPPLREDSRRFSRARKSRSIKSLGMINSRGSAFVVGPEQNPECGVIVVAVLLRAGRRRRMYVDVPGIRTCRDHTGLGHHVLHSSG